MNNSKPAGTVDNRIQVFWHDGWTTKTTKKTARPRLFHYFRLPRSFPTFPTSLPTFPTSLPTFPTSSQTFPTSPKRISEISDISDIPPKDFRHFRQAPDTRPIAEVARNLGHRRRYPEIQNFVHSRDNNDSMKRIAISLFNNTHVKNEGIESCFLIHIMYYLCLRKITDIEFTHTKKSWHILRF